MQQLQNQAFCKGYDQINWAKTEKFQRKCMFCNNPAEFVGISRLEEDRIEWACLGHRELMLDGTMTIVRFAPAHKGERDASSE